MKTYAKKKIELLGYPCFFVQQFKLVLILIGLMVGSQNVLLAQGKEMFKPLSVGEKVPTEIWDLKFKGINMASFDSENQVGHTNQLSLKNFRGKLIILDFWGTFCIPCINTFPKMFKLEDKFANDLKVILVNSYEPEEKVVNLLKDRFLKNNEVFDNIISDTILSQLFPHKVIPHYVWINNNGTVIATTDQEEITEAKIRNAINGQEENIINVVNVNLDHPIFVPNDLKFDEYTRYSILFKGRLPGVGTYYKKRMDSTGKKVRGEVRTNSTIKDLLRTYAQTVAKLSGTEIADNLVFYEGDRQKQLEDLYSYEFDIPVNLASNLYPMIVEDLSAFSPFKVSIEQRNINCWVLAPIQKDDFSKLTTNKKRGTVEVQANFEGKNKLISGEGIKIAQFIATANLIQPKTVFVSHTNHNDRVSLKLDLSEDISLNNEQLKKYGLYFKETFEKLSIIVIRDNKRYIE